MPASTAARRNCWDPAIRPKSRKGKTPQASPKAPEARTARPMLWTERSAGCARLDFRTRASCNRPKPPTSKPQRKSAPCRGTSWKKIATTPTLNALAIIIIGIICWMDAS
jgi:hypothetical protein